MSLSDVLTDPRRKQALLADGVSELEAELEDHSCLSGIALRTGYKTVRKLRPRFIEQNVEKLMPMFATVVDPHIVTGRQAGSVTGHFTAHAAEIAEGLLGATDKRAAEATNNVAKKAYEKLRPRAKENVIAGMPRLARLAERHAV